MRFTKTVSLGLAVAGFMATGLVAAGNTPSKTADDTPSTTDKSLDPQQVFTSAYDSYMAELRNFIGGMERIAQSSMTPGYWKSASSSLSKHFAPVKSASNVEKAEELAKDIRERLDAGLEMMKKQIEDASGMPFDEMMAEDPEAKAQKEKEEKKEEKEEKDDDESDKSKSKNSKYGKDHSEPADDSKDKEDADDVEDEDVSDD